MAAPARPADAWRYGLVYSTYAVVFADEDGGSSSTQWLDGDATSRPFPIAAYVGPPGYLEVIGQYLRLGFLHIVPHGLDHILFVLGLFLLTTQLWPLLAQVTAFTVAHSMTLGLTMERRDFVVLRQAILADRSAALQRFGIAACLKEQYGMARLGKARGDNPAACARAHDDVFVHGRLRVHDTAPKLGR